MSKKILIVGTGMYGCLTAYKISKKFPNYQITLIDKSDKILSGFNPININNTKINNGHHLIEVERNKGLYEFIKSLKIALKKINTSRAIVIENTLIRENSPAKYYPNNIFNKKNIKTLTSNNYSKIYKEIPLSLKNIIKKTSLRYSKNFSETLGSFIPWFLPKEFNYKSKDEGDLYRYKIRKSNLNSSGIIPKSGLVETLRIPLYKKIKKIKNIDILLNTRVSFNSSQLKIFKKNQEIKNKYDFVFICSSPISILKEINFKNFKKLLVNPRNFGLSIIKLKEKSEINFNEILIMNSKIIELSRISKIYSDKTNKKYLMEFSFANEQQITKKFEKHLYILIKSIFNLKSNFKISKIVFSRQTFKPNNSDLIKAENLIKNNLNNKNIKVLGKINFIPRNLSKVWNYSDLNVKLLNELSR